MAVLNKKVACFFTGGWTELNAMKIFLGKINNSIDFVQYCPTGEKKRKKPFKRELGSKYSGLTGKSLYEYIDSYISKYSDELSSFDAVLIEDDLDDQLISFYDENNYIQKKEYIKQQYKMNVESIKENIRDKLNKDSSFPVIVMHAAPEVEAWFCADWKNTFGYIYGPEVENKLSFEANKSFSMTFKKYVYDNVLVQYKNCLELYGSFGGKYRKLSDQIATSLREEYKIQLDSDSEKIYLEIKNNQDLVYSKRIEGQYMLMNLEPKLLEKDCNLFYRDVFYEIKELGKK